MLQNENEIQPATGIDLAISLAIKLLVRPAGGAGEWQDFEQGPGRFVIPAGHEVCLRARNIDDDDLMQLCAEIRGCPAVVCLDLAENRKVTDLSLSRISGLTQLRLLNLSSCDITDRGLAWLSENTNLQMLILSYCSRLRGSGLKHLRALSNLTYLDLQGCPRINHATIVKTVARRGLTVHT